MSNIKYPVLSSLNIVAKSIYKFHIFLFLIFVANSILFLVIITHFKFYWQAFKTVLGNPVD